MAMTKPRPTSQPHKPRRPTTSAVGGHTALTPQVQATIIKVLRQGNYFEIACRVAGIAPATGWRWLKDGQDRIAEDGTVIAALSPYREFREAVEQADAETEADLVERWKRVARSTPFGRTDSIERLLGKRYRPRWQEKASIEVSGPEGRPLEVVATADGDYIAGVIEALARAGVLPLAGDVGQLTAGDDAEAPEDVHPPRTDPDPGSVPPAAPA